LEESIEPPRVVVLRGPPVQLRQWQEVLGQRHLPDTLILAVPEGIAGLSPLLAKPAVPGAVNAWVCQGVTCLPPVEKLEMLLELLQARELR